MKKRTRTILFFICLVLFILVTPLVIFYSQGYRFDADSKKITQSGAFFLKVAPKQAKIYIDGRLKKETNFFFGSVLIENLLPKKYKIRIEKDGYFAWEKNLEIKEREVTEAKNITLIPEKPSFTLLTPGQTDETTEIKDFWFSPDEKKMVLYESSKEGWALKLYNLETNVKSHLIDEADVYSKGADFLSLSFGKNPNEIYLDAAVKEQEKNFVLNLEKTPPLLTQREISKIPENIVISQVFNGNEYSLDDSGNLFRNNERLSEKSFPVKKETEYALETFQNFIFLGEGRTLYLFNPDLKLFERFFDDAENLKISADEKKLVYFSSSEIWVLFLKEKYDQPLKKAGEKLFIGRFSEKINDVFWLNSDYLIFDAGDKIKIAEIDERDKIQVWDLTQTENQKFFFNENNGKLYVLSNGNLYTSENLIK